MVMEIKKTDNPYNLQIPAIKKKILLSLFMIMGIFLIFGEYLNSFFNIRFDQNGYSYLYRIRFAFKPMVIALYAVFTSVLYFLVIKYLSPLFDFIREGKNYEKARTAAVKIPWISMLFQVGIWAFGTIVYYWLKNWNADSGIPLLFGLLQKAASGIISSIYAAFIINHILEETKLALKIKNININENDFFSRQKDYFALGGSAIFLISNYSYIAWYFSQKPAVIPLSDFIQTVTPFSLLLLIFAAGSIRLAKREYKFQISTLMNGMEKLCSGGGEEISLINFDELGEMALQVNKVLQKFKNQIRQIQNVVSGLDKMAGALSSSAQQSSVSSNQQAAAVVEVVATMEDADKLSRSIGEKTSQVRAQAANVSSSVQTGDQTIACNLEANESIKTANEKTKDFIRELNKDIKSIWDVIMIINTIADHVKIIAFNAELEASAAGDAGKNFSVVAKEIRRLADNTVSSTSEIKEKITLIEKAGEKLNTASKEATALIDSGLEISNTASRIFRSILLSSQEAALSSQAIEEKINMQITAFEQILLGMKQISAGLSDAAANTAVASETAEMLTELVKSLKSEIS